MVSTYCTINSIFLWKNALFFHRLERGEDFSRAATWGEKKVVFKFSSLVFENFYISSFNNFLIDRWEVGNIVLSIYSVVQEHFFVTFDVSLFWQISLYIVNPMVARTLSVFFTAISQATSMNIYWSKMISNKNRSQPTNR